MALVIPNNYGVVTATFNYVPFGKQIAITFGYQDVSGGTPVLTDANQIRGYMIGANSIAEAVRLTTAWQLLEVSCLKRDSTGMLTVGANTTILTGTGTPATPANPIFTSFVVTKRTAYAGKKFRGRYYMPGFQLSEDLVDAVGNIGGGAVGIEQTRQALFLSQMSAGGVPMMLLHEASTPGPSAPNPVTSLQVRPVIGIQRRRRARGA